ncbi:MAG: hypothetical protein EAZ25_09890 [Oscillatoriales cyanobacterium]|nr:MAG: hypothetical protein EAZ25_09890 [Oscillatoriales cyanobacterium]
MGNGEWGMGNGEWGWGMGNGEWGMGNGEWGMGNGEIFYWRSISIFSSLIRSFLPPIEFR